MLEVSGPLWVSFQRTTPVFPECSHMPRNFGVDQITGTPGWSVRFAPTA
jgi:hypothetical protein